MSLLVKGSPCLATLGMYNVGRYVEIKIYPFCILNILIVQGQAPIAVDQLMLESKCFYPNKPYSESRTSMYIPVQRYTHNSLVRNTRSHNSRDSFTVFHQTGTDQINLNSSTHFGPQSPTCPNARLDLPPACSIRNAFRRFDHCIHFFAPTDNPGSYLVSQSQLSRPRRLVQATYRTCLTPEGGKGEIPWSWSRSAVDMTAGLTTGEKTLPWAARVASVLEGIAHDLNA